MKKILLLIALPCILVLFATCEKFELATKITTVSVTPGITSVTAVGNILDLSSSSHSDYGFCYGTDENPTVSNGKVALGKAKIGGYVGVIEGLITGQKYYIRAYCKDGDGYVYGEAKTATTSATASVTVTDVDGNVYNTVTIGTQTWMKENLKTTKYRDGSTITKITDNSAWINQTAGAYCWYNNDANTNKDTYGAMYNWYTVVDSRNLCPVGWHIPTDAEWSTLSTYLGGESVAGGKMKSTSLWANVNVGADNSSGFTALPGGFRNTDGTFNNVNTYGFWWSGTTFNTNSVLSRIIYYAEESLNRSSGFPKICGMSVRCIKDQQGQVLPTVTTTTATSITQTTASSGGNVTSDGGAAITERGICYSTSQTPTTANSKVTATGTTGAFTSNISGLTAGTTYYVRAYATNSLGTAYGNEVSFTTLTAAMVPTLTTTAATSIAQTSASSGGNVTSDGGSAITERGICYSTTQTPTTANSKVTATGTTGAFTSNITGLTAGTTYYVRAYATNSLGTAYGDEVSFTTLAAAIVPTLTTTAATSITQTTASSGGNVTSDGGSAITERGICYSTTQTPTTANSKVSATGTTGAFTSNITGLTAGTTYYVRAYATNSVGTGYGDQVTFTTETATATITDIDGNTYNTVTIGTQTWIKENLRTTKYRDGTAITNITDNTAWTTQTTGAYCWYNNDINNKPSYGALYNYHAVVDSRKLCPTGWHVPTDAEWTTLETFLGGSLIAGGKLKSTSIWQSPNTDATNVSGFSALPSGGRNGTSGPFFNGGNYCSFWCDTEYDATNAWYRYLLYNSGSLTRAYYDKKTGYSVRCVKD